MWIEDLTKALWMLNGTDLRYNCLIQKIENGYIYTTVPGLRFEIKTLVEAYNKEYGETQDS